MFLKYLTDNKREEVDFENETKKQIEKKGIAAIASRVTVTANSLMHAS